MPEVQYRGRRAHTIENDQLRVTILVEGGHVSEILHKPTGVNPLWTPPWHSIEPSAWSVASHPEYGNDAESKLLSGIMGHNLCLDLFGPPSPEEAAAGVTVHGDASIFPYEFEERDGELEQKVTTNSGLAFRRRLRLEGASIRFAEQVRNNTMYDRPIAWTQHVTLGPPFLEKGTTRFNVPATHSRTLDERDFEWPYLPHSGGAREDLRVFTSAPSSGGFTTHLMEPVREHAWFIAWSPAMKLFFGYAWRRSDFPWLGIWEENYSRSAPPWNGRTLTRGMEFGVSPMPESRRKMIHRNSLFGVPAYRWVPAGTEVEVEYSAFAGTADEIPNEPPVSPR